jgi:hypothetical protein
MALLTDKSRVAPSNGTGSADLFSGS